jgi:hypothetical protein
MFFPGICPAIHRKETPLGAREISPLSLNLLSLRGNGVLHKIEETPDNLPLDLGGDFT